VLIFYLFNFVSFSFIAFTVILVLNTKLSFCSTETFLPVCQCFAQFNVTCVRCQEGGNDTVKNKCDNPETVEDLCLLDHTHFILVDDGTVNKFGAEVDLRVAMERYVTNRNISFKPKCEGLLCKKLC
jgi:hypothetical protein